MTELRHLPLVDASVPETATFEEATRLLTSADVAGIAILDAERKVKGVFTHAGLLRGAFPGYLAELKHTAFLDDDAVALAARADAVRTQGVEQYLEEVEPLTLTDSQIHAAERFLHAEVEALPVVDDERRFVGMLGIGALCAATAARLTEE